VLLGSSTALVSARAALFFSLRARPVWLPANPATVVGDESFIGKWAIFKPLVVSRLSLFSTRAISTPRIFSAGTPAAQTRRPGAAAAPLPLPVGQVARHRPDRLLLLDGNLSVERS
jgi:hypothetical protein